MTIIFTDEEKEYIDKKPFNWTIKNGCPDDVKKTLLRKLKLLYNENQKDYVKL